MKWQLRSLIWGIIGGALGWGCAWLLLDELGVKSIVYPGDGLRVYLAGFGTISGYAAGQWGWIAMMRLTNDWQDTFGPYPQVPDEYASEARSSSPQKASRESKTESDG